MKAVPDLFAVLGLPRRFRIEVVDLERRFHEWSRLVHPDRFARASLPERRKALEEATRLNDAYRTLKDPRRRAAYLLTLLDPAAPTPTLAPDFLEEQLEMREKLAQARARGDGAAVTAIAARAREAIAAIDRQIAEALAGDAPTADAMAAARDALARLRYHEAVLAEADGAISLGATR